jgi:DNA-binding CsgD family transcriptional regulator
LSELLGNKPTPKPKEKSFLMRLFGTSPANLVPGCPEDRSPLNHSSIPRIGEPQIGSRKQKAQAPPESLRELGLTAREAEVLYWVSEGKRNIEIGIILGARPRTITKHLERIFEKLGVETRSAAAARALEHLFRVTVSKPSNSEIVAH